MVRDYSEEDFGSIWKINVDSFPKHEPEWFIKEAIAKGHTWVYEVNGEIVGFLVGKIKYGTPYVHNVAVKKEYRGFGYATSLFEAFEKFYGEKQKPENKMFWLQVEDSNPAQKLYFDLGYKVHFVDENYYGSGQHALCMYKSARPISSK